MTTVKEAAISVASNLGNVVESGEVEQVECQSSADGVYYAFAFFNERDELLAEFVVDKDFVDGMEAADG